MSQNKPARGADKSGPTLYLVVGVLVIFYGGYSALSGAKGSWGNWVLVGVGVIIAALGLYLRTKAAKAEEQRETADDGEGGSQAE